MAAEEPGNSMNTWCSLQHKLSLWSSSAKNMAGGGFTAEFPASDHSGSLTTSVIVTCIMAASGGLIFGYDIGISGGVTTMESFLRSFFPGVLKKMAEAKQDDEYCMYDSQALTAFTSSLYVAGLAASLAAGRLTKAVGRQAIMLLGRALFFTGAAVNASAANVEMLILGRILLGFGVGFTNQAAPVYLAEVSLARWRGAFTTGFQFFIGVGVVAANLTNYGAARLRSWGWRLSLGLAAAPACVFILGALLIPDTPSSLLHRGMPVDAARAVLRRLRSSSADVDAELNDIARAAEDARRNEEGAFARMVLGRRYRPQLVMAVAIPLFQQLTGVTVVAFFAPVLFRTVGFGSDGALVGAVILGCVNLASILVSAFTVDRLGRRKLFIGGGAQMIICQLLQSYTAATGTKIRKLSLFFFLLLFLVFGEYDLTRTRYVLIDLEFMQEKVAVAWIMGAKIGADGEAAMPKGYAAAVLVLMCAFSAGFGLSWGPLSWIIPGEIFPVEVRSAGQAISVAVNLGCTFIQTQLFLTMLCRFKFATFAYFAAWVALMTAFVAAFLPETKGVPLESMGSVWERHWYWARFIADDNRAHDSKVNIDIL